MSTLGGDVVRREDAPEAELLRREPRLHRRRPRHLAEPQRAVRSHEVVEAAEELQVIIERPLLPCMARGTTTQVGRALTNREIQPLDERGAQLRRVLRVLKRIGKSPLRTHDQSRSHAHDSVALDPLDDLGEHAPEAKHVANRGRVELESVGRDQRRSRRMSARSGRPLVSIPA